MTSPTKLAEKVENFTDDLGDNIEDGLEEGMKSTEYQTKNNIRLNDSIVNSTLINSVDYERDVLQSHRFSRSVIVDAGHSAYVEYGTGSNNTGPVKFPAPSPGPPIGKIKAWLIRKGTPLDTIRDPSLKTFGEVYINQQETLDYLAHAIADQIGKYGNKAHPFARPAARSGFSTTSNLVEQQMSHSVRRF